LFYSITRDWFCFNFQSGHRTRRPTSICFFALARNHRYAWFERTNVKNRDGNFLHLLTFYSRTIFLHFENSPVRHCRGWFCGFWIEILLDALGLAKRIFRLFPHHPHQPTPIPTLNSLRLNLEIKQRNQKRRKTSLFSITSFQPC
jgi:hypothetical protein